MHGFFVVINGAIKRDLVGLGLADALNLKFVGFIRRVDLTEECVFPMARERSEALGIPIDAADRLRPRHHTTADTPNLASIHRRYQIRAIFACPDIHAGGQRDIELHPLAIDPRYRLEFKATEYICPSLRNKLFLTREIVDQLLKRRSRLSGLILLQVALTETDMRLSGQ